MMNQSNAAGPTAHGILGKIYGEKSVFWKKMRAVSGLHAFKAAVRDVPAYKDFLLKEKINAAHINSAAGLKTVPSVNKQNYLRAYPFEQLCKGGALRERSVVYTSTSGSTGAPFYFPRNDSIDLRSSIYHEMFLRNSLLPADRSTLIMVCFGMGVWIGGLITYQAFKTISARSYRLAILTPGVNKKEIFEALKNIAPQYDQIVLCGYPPFIKDVVDEAGSHGVDWKKMKIKLIFAAEAFSEKFRDHLAESVGIKNAYRDTMNIYGSADLGTMAVETPVSILVRRLALASGALYKKLFKEAGRLPTLAQFHPAFVNFEEDGGRVYCTSDNILPLVKYDIGDNGGVIDFDEVERIFSEQGMNLKDEVRRAGLADTLAELPFVYVYERSDLSVKLYGVIVYPEHVKAGLLDCHFSRFITGKFAMSVRHDNNQDEYLEINVELTRGQGAPERLAEEISKSVLESLTDKSAEYKNNVDAFAGKVQPRIVLWPYEDPAHFSVGAKQKWVIK
jgi:phenylacetate-CoA ligase